MKEKTMIQCAKSLMTSFKIRSNVIYKGARFNKRNQLPGESAEKYIVELYTRARNCNYGEFTSEMIRDRLVIGIRDKTLSEKLQLDPGLTLEQAKKLVCQREAVHEQQQALKKHPEALDEDFTGLTMSTTMNEIRGNQGRKQRHQRHQKLCSRYGRGQHPWERCPARDAECYKCHKKGHFSSQCLSKRVATCKFGHHIRECSIYSTLRVATVLANNAYFTTACTLYTNN